MSNRQLLKDADTMLTVVISSADLPSSLGPDIQAGPIDNEYGEWNIRDANLGMSYYPTEILRTMHAQFYIVDDIDIQPKDSQRGGVAGLHASYFRDKRTHDILIADTASGPVYIHELAHGLQRELCGEGSRFHAVVDQLQAEGVQMPYLNNDQVTVNGELIEISGFRQFADTWGAQNILEDWATMLTDTLYRRGIVADGDVDYGSVYQRKQTAMIDDIEARFPGFRNAIQPLSDFYRALPSSPYNQYLASIVSERTVANIDTATLLTAEDLGLDSELLLIGGERVSYLWDSVLVMNHTDEPFINDMISQIIYDPLVYVNEENHVYVGYVREAYPGADLDIRFYAYDPAHMVFLRSQDIQNRPMGKPGMAAVVDQQLVVDSTPIAIKAGSTDPLQNAKDTATLGSTLTILTPEQLLVLLSSKPAPVTATN